MPQAESGQGLILAGGRWPLGKSSMERVRGATCFLCGSREGLAVIAEAKLDGIDGGYATVHIALCQRHREEAAASA